MGNRDILKKKRLSRDVKIPESAHYSATEKEHLFVDEKEMGGV